MKTTIKKLHNSEYLNMQNIEVFEQSKSEQITNIINKLCKSLESCKLPKIQYYQHNNQ